MAPVLPPIPTPTLTAVDLISNTREFTSPVDLLTSNRSLGKPRSGLQDPSLGEQVVTHHVLNGRSKLPAPKALSASRAAYLRTVIEDMKLPHEGSPQGVPSHLNWARGPRIGRGNNASGFTAFVAWGQLYEAAEGNPATNTRVQIRNIQAYVLSKKDGRWRLLQQSRRVEGAAYREDYVDDVNKAADIRSEPDGSISVTAGDGYNFHFWTRQGRTTIDPEDIGGLLTTVQARLIINNPQQTDDRDQARYLLSMGGDYWRNLTAQWSSSEPNNGDVGIGRFKYVTTEWQTFNMTTLSPAQLRRTPPPIFSGNAS